MSALIRRGQWWIGVTDPKPQPYGKPQKLYKVSVSHRALITALKAPGARPEQMSAEWWVENYRPFEGTVARYKPAGHGVIIVKEVRLDFVRAWLDFMLLTQEIDRMAVTFVPRSDGTRFIWGDPFDPALAV